MSLTYFFLSLQQKARAHASCIYAGVSPIFKSSSIGFFTRDKWTTRVVASMKIQPSGKLSSAKSRWTKSFSTYLYLYALPIILSLSFPHLTLRKRSPVSRKYILFSNIYIYIFLARANRSTLFFFPPRGGEQQTRAYLLLPRLKSIFAITRPVHGNSDSRRRYSPSL